MEKIKQKNENKMDLGVFYHDDKITEKDWSKLTFPFSWLDAVALGMARADVIRNRSDDSISEITIYDNSGSMIFYQNKSIMNKTEIIGRSKDVEMVE